MSVRVTSFQSFGVSRPFALADPTVLVGSNGAGKSTLLRAIRFLLTGQLDGIDDVQEAEHCIEATVAIDASQAASLGVAPELSIRRIRVAGTRSRQPASLEIECDAPEDPRLRDLESQTVSALRATADDLLADSPPAGDRRQAATFLEPLSKLADDAPKKAAWVKAPERLHDLLPKPVWFASTEEPDAASEIRASLDSAVGSILSEDPLKTTLVEAAKRVDQALDSSIARIAQAISASCPDLAEPSIEAKFSFARSLSPVSLTYGDEAHDHSAMGAGERRRVSLAVWEATAEEWAESESSLTRGRIVFYDEPDTHLDFERQRALTQLLSSQAAREDTQVIVATHSPHLMDGVEPDGIVVLERSSGASSLLPWGGESEEVRDHCKRAALSLGIRNSTLLNERAFVLVEGESEERAFPLLFRAATGRRCETAGITFIRAGGNASALPLARHLVDLGRDVKVLVDHDSTRLKEFGLDRLRQCGIADSDIRYLGTDEQPELEGLFSDALWAEAVEGKWSRGDGRMWLAGDFASLRSADKFSKALEAAVRAVAHPDSPLLSKPALVLEVAQGIGRDAIPDQIKDAMEWLIA